MSLSAVPESSTPSTEPSAPQSTPTELANTEAPVNPEAEFSKNIELCFNLISNAPYPFTAQPTVLKALTFLDQLYKHSKEPSSRKE